MACVISEVMVVSQAHNNKLDAFLPRYYTNQKAFTTHHGVLVADKQKLDLLWKIRGGSDTEEEEEEDEISLESSSGAVSPILTKVRNIIRSVLDIGERKAPGLAKPIRSLLTTLEGILGVDLLPPQKKEKKSKKKDKKKKNKAKKQKEEEDEDSAAEEEKKQPKTKKPSAATTKHLNQKLTTTNPNYRIQKELKSFIKDPPPNLSVKVGKNIRVWIVTMEGAQNTIYEGEVFKLRVSFPPQYPTMPPSVYFLPPNIP